MAIGDGFERGFGSYCGDIYGRCTMLEHFVLRKHPPDRIKVTLASGKVLHIRGRQGLRSPAPCVEQDEIDLNLRAPITVP